MLLHCCVLLIFPRRRRKPPVYKYLKFPSESLLGGEWCHQAKWVGGFFFVLAKVWWLGGGHSGKCQKQKEKRRWMCLEYEVNPRVNRFILSPSLKWTYVRRWFEKEILDNFPSIWLYFLSLSLTPFPPFALPPSMSWWGLGEASGRPYGATDPLWVQFLCV